MDIDEFPALDWSAQVTFVLALTLAVLVVSWMALRRRMISTVGEQLTEDEMKKKSRYVPVLTPVSNAALPQVR